jgi:hypothetical protein
VEHVLQSQDRVVVVRGAAGTGKTSMMREAVEAIEANGTKVFTFAPSAGASRGVLRDEGFKDADTVSLLLKDERLQQSVAGQAIWIDESGLMGTRTMAQVFNLAERLDARVILSGDRRQHGSVDRGAALRLLEEAAGIVPAEIRDIQRQKGNYKQIVEALSEGRTAEAFGQLDKLGWIKEVDQSERYKVLAKDYMAAVSKGESTLVVSPTHLEAEWVTPWPAAEPAAMFAANWALTATPAICIRTWTRAMSRSFPVNVLSSHGYIRRTGGRSFTTAIPATCRERPRWTHSLRVTAY